MIYWRNLMKSLRRRSIVLFFAAAAVTGCVQNETITLEREKLFEMNMGKMEDQLDLIQLPGENSLEQTRLFMRSGLFYVLNGDSGKLMEFNSFGDILTLFYNPGENPEPVLLASQGAEGKDANRNAYGFPFNSLTNVAVTSLREILVVDQVPPQRVEKDPESDMAWNRMVLRFNPDGTLRDSLGQEGIGGTPFPFVERLDITDNDETVVTCLGIEKWVVFWFDPQGQLKYRVEIPLDNLPGPDVENLVPFFDTVCPSRTEDKLYLKLDYSQVPEETGQSSSGLKFYKSMVYEYDMTQGAYTGFFDIPKNYIEGSGTGIFDTKRYEMLYEFMGLGGRDRLFFMSPSGPDQQEVLIMDRRGRPLKRVLIHISDAEVFYRDFSLSDDGILSALLVRDYGAEVAWWRTDKVIGE